jgi:hypothetical protein
VEHPAQERRLGDRIVVLGHDVLSFQGILDYDALVQWQVRTPAGSIKEEGEMRRFSGAAGTFTDTTQGIELFSFSAAKGSGSGMHNQATITCTSSETGTAADLGGVPGIPDTDTVESDFTAVAVVKP